MFIITSLAHDFSCYSCCCCISLLYKKSVIHLICSLPTFSYRQAVELTERTSSEQAAAIREPLTSVNRRWEALLRAMVDRQRQLEHALLHLGQFQHALSELLVWIQKTDTTLDQLKPVSFMKNIII